jgi:hypothetical protein
MVSDNRHLTKIIYALADKADFNVKGVAQSLMPLAEQIERRRDDERRTRCRSDGFDRDDRLPGAGGQNDYAALIKPSPCRDGLILIIIELNFRSWLKVKPSWVVMTGAVSKRNFSLSQPEDGVAVTMSFRPPGADSLIHDETWDETRWGCLSSLANRPV